MKVGLKTVVGFVCVIFSLTGSAVVRGEQMPPVSYFTRMDYFVPVSTLLVFAALVQATETARLASAGKVQTAVKIDRWCRALFPGILVATIVLCLIV